MPGVIEAENPHPEQKDAGAVAGRSDDREDSKGTKQSDKQIRTTDTKNN